MRILFLDDDEERHWTMRRRYPDDELWHAYDIDEFRRFVEDQSFDIISLDHDLGDFVTIRDDVRMERTGMDAVRILVESDRQPGCVIVHSWNPIGAKNMMQALREAGIVAYQALFMYEE